jgi:hypothetical protein
MFATDKADLILTAVRERFSNKEVRWEFRDYQRFLGVRVLDGHRIHSCEIDLDFCPAEQTVQSVMHTLTGEW